MRTHVSVKLTDLEMSELNTIRELIGTTLSGAIHYVIKEAGMKMLEDMLTTLDASNMENE